MVHKSPKAVPTAKYEPKVLSIYWWILAIMGLAGCLWLILIPSDPKGSILLGFSPLRLLLLGILLVITVFFTLLGSNFRPLNETRKWFLKKMEDQSFQSFLSIISFIFLFLAISFHLFLPIFQGGRFIAHYQRLSPLVTWLLVFSFITPLCLHYLNKPESRPLLSVHRRLARVILIIFTCLIALWVIIAITGVGTIPDPTYWDDHKPVPLMEGQLFVIFWATGFFFLLYHAVKKQKSPQQRSKAKNSKNKSWLTAGIFLVIWLSAILLWKQAPIPNSYFTPPVKPPNNEVYPYSDARIHDSDSLGILLGEVSASQRIIRRPLYAVFLSGVHTIGGNDYTTIILLQTIVLALVPALIYLLGSRMGNRPAGILAAIFTILIEWNTLQVASLTTTSNTKLLMTEWPAMFLLVTLVYSLVNWADKSEEWGYRPLIVGGSLGGLILLRSQSLILIPFIFIIFFIYLKGKWKTFLFSSGLFILGVLILISPLLMRNSQITGKLTFEDPRYTQAVIQRFEEQKYIGGIPQQEELNESNTDLFGAAFRFMLNNPVQYIGFVANNFFHNEILDIFILPFRSIPIQGVTDLFDARGLFWLKSENRIYFPQMLLLSLYLALLAIGCAYAFTHWKLRGLIPLIIHLAYNFSNAISRISGWRFFLPVQWVLIFYFSLGIIQILQWIFCYFGISIKNFTEQENHQSQTKSFNDQKTNNLIRKTWATLSILLMLGALFPFLMTAIPSRYAGQNREELIQQLFSDKIWGMHSAEKNEIESQLANKDMTILKGMSFYPRFYQEDDGEPGLNPGIYKPEPYPRLLFLLISDKRQDILLPIKTSPEFFPNGSEVIVAGRETASGFEAILVNIIGEQSAIYFADSSLAGIHD